MDRFKRIKERLYSLAESDENIKALVTIIFTPDKFRDAVMNGYGNEVMDRGYFVMYDAMGITGILKEFIKPDVKYNLLSKEEFHNMVNDFLFHIIWASKKVQRGELWTAKLCIDSYLQSERHVLRVSFVCVNR